MNGEKIGSIEDVRYGDATGGLKWLLVKTGLFGTKKIIVPAGEVRATEDALVVPYTKDRVKDAPGVDENEMFTTEEEQNMCAYYGLEYLSSFGAPTEGCVEGETEAGVASPEPPAATT